MKRALPKRGPATQNYDHAESLMFKITMEEFKALRDELLQTMKDCRNVLYLLIAVSAAVTAVLDKIISQHLQLLLLLLPLAFVALQLMFLRFMLLHIEIMRHIKDEIVPILRAEVSESGGDAGKILTWYEATGWLPPTARYPISYVLIPAVPAVAPTAASMASIALFFGTQGPDIVRTGPWVALLVLTVIAVVGGFYLSVLVGSQRLSTNVRRRN